MKRKTFTLFMALMLSVSMCINVSAASNQYIYTVDDVTVIFDSNTMFDEETREYVAHYLVHGSNEATTYGLMCTLFGHSYESSLVATITHRVNDTDPRCLEETYKVQTCKRCDASITERIAYDYITCCPEE